MVPLYVLRAKRRGYEVSVMKALMDLLGLAGGPVRPPLAMLTPGGNRHAARHAAGVEDGNLTGSGLKAQGSGKILETELLERFCLSPEP